jgi:PEGA domain
VKSTPDEAEITIAGKYVGSTPSTLTLAAGEHIIKVEKQGFTPWLSAR